MGDHEGCSDEEMADMIGSTEFLQNGFLEWEKKGKVYRFDQEHLPPKFKDATLSKSEMALIYKVKQIIRNGRVVEITNTGEFRFEDGTTTALPWDNAVSDTTFVHCSAGAFNYSKQTGKKIPPIFGEQLIKIQDVYGTPGFCFVGSIIAKIAALDETALSNEDKNAMCLAPVGSDIDVIPSSLGPSGGDVGTLSPNHGWVQPLSNTRHWYKHPEIRDWLRGHRLFNLGHLSLEEAEQMLEETWEVIKLIQP